MKCPYCSRPGLRRWKGYCCKAHRKLHRKPAVRWIPCTGCGAPQRRVPSNTAKSGRVFCRICKRSKGENHYKWKEGSYIDNAGYRMLLVNGLYMREHRIEWQLANKATLFDRGTIHHIRFDLPFNKTYNDPDNLLLLSDEEHGRFHRLYDAARFDEAIEVLQLAAKRQLHYPKEIDNFINTVLGNPR